jgi:hypothetical protein
MFTCKLCNGTKIYATVECVACDGTGQVEHNYVNIFDLIGKVRMENYCSSKNYWIWEQNVAEPALILAGFKIGKWQTLDGDSYGPLVRGIKVVKDNNPFMATYG